MGGEKLYEQMERQAGRGSPPHGRGKADQPARNRPAFRITPAWAGKSRISRYRPPRLTDHPRMGGEKGEQTSTLEVKLGSPPHGRGKDATLVDHHGGVRITPAWAGKSQQMLKDASHGQDHPRMGGEKAGMKFYRAAA